MSIDERRGRLSCAGVVVLAAIVCAPTFASGSRSVAPNESDRLDARAADPALTRILKAARAYLQDYETKLTLVLADEDYVQEIRDQQPFDPSMPQKRRMKSEVYFVRSPDGAAWTAVRDVVAVDNRPIRDRPNTAVMFGTTPVMQVADAVRARNARFNIGRIVRTSNEPTLAMQMLDASREADVEFKLNGTGSDHGTEVATLAFSEHGRDTLVHDLAGKPAASSGEILVESGTGRVRRTEIRTLSGRVWSTVTLTYAANQDLEMWLPSVLQERYRDGVYASAADRALGGGEREDISGEAHYSHFRRFEVTGGIKK